MKHMKRAAALFLALIMIMSLAVTAYATTTPGGKITINGTTSVPVKGKTFKAYKVLEATMKDPTDSSKGISYRVPDVLKEFFAKRYCGEPDNSSKVDAYIADADFHQNVITALNNELTNGDKYKIARDLLAAAKSADITGASAVVDADHNKAVFSELELGYYVIEDTATEAPVSSVMLDTAVESANGAEVTIKAETSYVDKKIDGANDGDATTGDTSVSGNTASIGDKVPFIVTSKVPDMTYYKDVNNFYFYVEDTLSAGLTFNDDVAVTVNGVAVANEDITVEKAGQVVTIVLEQFYTKYHELGGKDIKITYSATVNDNAVIGTAGNKNTVILNYSNNPNVKTDGDKPDTDEEKKVIGKTPASETYTYVTALEITKQDDSTSPIRLSGAEFELSGTRMNTVLVKTEKFDVDEAGTYYKLKTNEYTTVKPQALGGSGNNDLYADLENAYKLTTESKKIEKTENVVYKGVTGENGILRFEGLGAGEYTLTELKAPDGYHKLDAPITINIGCTYPSEEATSNDCTWTVTENGTAANGIITTTVVNKSGSVLPETGGMGTTIFYVMGSMLVLASAALLVADKRRKMF